MGKRETKESYKDTKAEKVASQRRYDEARADSAERAAGLGGVTGESRDAYLSSINSLAPASIGSAGRLTAPSISSRMMDMPAAISVDNASLENLQDVLGRYRNLGPAYTEAQKAAIGGDVAALREFGRTGGLDATAINRMRGMGGFDEFASTGGYSPTQIANIKAQAISPIGSYATGTRDELSRRIALQGGYAPGFDAANRQLQRDTARAVADTSLNANIGIQDRVNAGRQWGIGGLAAAEHGLQTLRTGNMLTGLTSASEIEMGLQDRINQYVLAGLSGQEATSRAIADVEGANAQRQLQANMFNTQARMTADQFNIGNQNQMAQFNAQNAMGADQFNIGNEQAVAEFNARNAQAIQQAKMAGMGNLYGSDVNQYQSELDRQNALLGGQTQANLGYLSEQNALGRQPGMGGSIIDLIGAGAGAAAGIWGAR